MTGTTTLGQLVPVVLLLAVVAFVYAEFADWENFNQHGILDVLVRDRLRGKIDPYQDDGKIQFIKVNAQRLTNPGVINFSSSDALAGSTEL